MKLYLDTETYSEVPIRDGTYKYLQNCTVMLLTWALDDGPVQCIDFTQPSGDDIRMFKNALGLRMVNAVIAHNAMFDRNALKYALDIDIPIERWRCTMVQALAHALPGSLSSLCDILKVDADKAKHEEGKKLIQLFCKPRPKTSKLRRANHATHPEEWKRFVEYAKADIEAMREIEHRFLPTWNYSGRELALWHLDQRINDRGMQIDLDLVDAALRAVDAEQKRLADKTHAATSGGVASTTQRDKLLEHILAEYGIALPDMQASTLERRIDDPDIPEELKELLRIRLQATTTSTSKYKALKRATSEDGRLRGTLQFDGASRTRRAAGRTFQPQNLPSRGLIDAEEIEPAIAMLKAGCEDLVYDNIMQVTSSTIRGCIVAPPGGKLVVADLSNIEGRIQAWLADEEWKLQAFRDFDSGTGEDLYKLAYARAFDIDAKDVTKPQRAIGKVMELMLGYEGGVGAYLTGAAGYNIDLEDMARLARPSIPDSTWEEATAFYEWQTREGRTTHGLSKEVFAVCDSLKRLWREAHPCIAALWKHLEVTAVGAVGCPGVTFSCARFKIRRDGAWLRILLPSGRYLCYPSPKVEDGKLSYMGNNQYARQWCRLHTYGGKLFENACQSVARDVLYDAMPNIEAAGYKIILTVHDEVVCEAPDTWEYNAENLSAILAQGTPWTEGLPLAAAGFEAYRYRKD